MKIHYKYLGIEFKGIFLKDVFGKYKIQVTEWIGEGYPHQYYYLTNEQYENSIIDSITPD